MTQSFEQQLAELETGNPPSPDAGFLGATLDPAECKLVIIPVPWEATTSYGGGTSRGPQAIVTASHQLDLEDSSFGKVFRTGITVLPEDPLIDSLNEKAKLAARSVIESVEQRTELNTEDLEFVNHSSQRVNQSVYESAKNHLMKNQFVAVLGGDHASPEGLIHALSETHEDGFGILHFDAHHDLRIAYEGFTDSHASIFYNVMERYKNIQKLVQVGIRDYSRDEKFYMDSSGVRGQCFYGRDLFRKKAHGQTFKEIAQEIVKALPAKVYISFDIDGLDPSYCPSTGTPVPGGLSFDEAVFILEELAASGKRVVGFDLCEVSPAGDGGDWDANVGARLLYKLCGSLMRSQKLC